MKKRLIPVICILAIVIQVFLFTVPASAASDMSLNRSNVWNDLLGESGTREQLEEKYPTDASDEQVRLLAFSSDLQQNRPIFFFYFYIPSIAARSDGNIESVTFNLMTYTGNQSESVEFDTLTLVGGVAKVKVTPSLNYTYFSSEGIAFRLLSSVWTFAGTTETHAAHEQDYSETDGFLSGALFIQYDFRSKVCREFASMDTLEIKVSLANERVSTPDADTWKQINTAMFLVPNDKFEAYGDLVQIDYKYDLYDKVAMLATTSDALYEYGKNTPPGSSFTVGFDGTTSWSSFYIPARSCSPFFVFKTDSLDTVGQLLFSESDVIQSFRAAQDSLLRIPYAGTFCDYLGCESYELDHHDSKTPSDEIRTESYRNTTEFWQRLFEGHLFVKDDSVKVNAIEVVSPEEVHQLGTSEKISDKYCIDESYVSEVRRLAMLAERTGARLVLLRYLVSDYCVNSGDLIDSAFYKYYSPYYDNNPNDPLRQYKGYCMADSVVVKQAIIDNFEILNLHFEKVDQESLTVTRTVINVDMDPVTGSGSGENSDSLFDGITSPWLRPSKDGGVNWMVILIAILVLIVVIFVLTKIFKLIGSARDAFGRRNKRNE